MAFKDLTMTQKVAQIARWIGILAVNPVLGGGGMMASKIAKIAATFGQVIETLDTTHEEMDKFYLIVEAIVKSQGHPTDAQWSVLESIDVTAREQLEANRVRLEAQIAAEKLDDEERSRRESEIALEAERQRAEEAAQSEAEERAREEAARLSVESPPAEEQVEEPATSSKKKKSSK